MNSATLYHHAETKEALLVGIMEEGLHELLRVGHEAVDGSADPEIQLARLVMAHVAMETVNQQISFVSDNELRWLGSDVRPRIVALRDDYEAILEGVLEEGARVGVFDVPDRRATRLGLLGMVNGIKSWYRPSRGTSVENIQDWFVDLALRLVRTGPVTREECEPVVVVAPLPSEPVHQLGEVVPAR